MTTEIQRGKELTEYSVFISCPSDCEAYKDVVVHTLGVVSSVLEKLISVRIKPIYYKTDISAGASQSTQEVINPKVLGQYDIYVGLFWTRVGTPTERYASGTVEELYSALEQKKEGRVVEVHLYFSEDFTHADFRRSDAPGLENLREQLRREGVLYKSFKSTLELGREIGLAIRDDVSILTSVTDASEPTHKLSKKPFVDHAESVSTGMAKLTELTSEAAREFERYNVDLRARTASMRRARNIKSELIMRQAVQAIVHRVAFDMNFVSERLEDYFKQAIEVGTSVIVELQLMLSLVPSGAKHFFRSHLEADLTRYRNTLASSLIDTSGLRASVTDLGFLYHEAIEGRKRMTDSLFLVEQFQTEMILGLDRIIMNYGSAEVIISSRKSE